MIISDGEIIEAENHIFYKITLEIKKFLNERQYKRIIKEVFYTAQEELYQI